MTTDTDADLRELFHAMKAGDDVAIPPFEVLASQLRSRPRRAPWRPTWAASGFALATAAALWLMLRPVATDAPAGPMPAWQTPTDGLLMTAGYPLQRLTWSNMPTAGLERSSFARVREDR
jgi:hypothetical protein